MRLLILALLLLTVGTARASVTYTLVDRVCSIQVTGTSGPCPGDHPPGFAITVSDRAVARGTFDLSGQGLPVAVVGDIADLVSLAGAVYYAPASGSGFYGQIDLHLSFAADGSVSSASIYQYGALDGAKLTGSSAAFGGWFDDEGLCQHGAAGRLCTESGRLQMVRTADGLSMVDEPATVGLIAMLLVVAVWRPGFSRR